VTDAGTCGARGCCPTAAAGTFLDPAGAGGALLQDRLPQISTARPTAPAVNFRSFIVGSRKRIDTLQVLDTHSSRTEV
jgi:hypothetical protein